MAGLLYHRNGMVSRIPSEKNRKNARKPLDIIHPKMYNKSTGQGKTQVSGKEVEPQEKGGKAVDDQDKRKQETKELLELLEKALTSETVERITITIKPTKKPKQP